MLKAAPPSEIMIRNIVYWNGVGEGIATDKTRIESRNTILKQNAEGVSHPGIVLTEFCVAECVLALPEFESESFSILPRMDFATVARLFHTSQ